LTTVYSKNMSAMISEESLRARQSGVKGDIQQVKKLTFLTAKHFNDAVPERGHSKYKGTNRGDAFGFVDIPPITDAWTLNFEAKKTIYGSTLVTTGTVDKDPRSHIRGVSPNLCFSMAGRHRFTRTCSRWCLLARSSTALRVLVTLQRQL